MKTGVLKFQRFKLVALDLAMIRLRCQTCYTRNHQPIHIANDLEHEHEHEHGHEHGHEHEHEHGHGHEHEHESQHTQHSSDSSSDYTPLLLLPIQHSSRRPVSEIQLPEQNNWDDYQMDADNDDDEFDDYKSALIVSNDDEADIIPNTWTFDRNGMLLLDKHWSLWRDRGYRLRPRFFSMFRDGDPILLHDHLLPYLKLGSEPNPDSDSEPNPDSNFEPNPDSNFEPNPDSNSNSNSNSNSISHPGSPLVPYSSSPPLLPSSLSSNHLMQTTLQDHPSPDAVKIGAQAMLDEAGSIEGKPQSQAAFIQGKTQDQKFIQLDLEKDQVDVEDEDVVLSIDIDSVIWVTNKPQFKGPIQLHLLPLLGDKPPFSINNHVYIRVLLPPTKQDCEIEQISQKTRTYPLSAIPHTHFGQIGQGSGQFNIYVFFPRMIRKDYGTGRMMTLIPREVQDLWFSEVVIPASRKALADCPRIMEYLPSSIDQLRWRIGDRRGHKTIPLAAQTIPVFYQALSTILSYKPNLLGRFGSFFVVIDSRGIKLLSKQSGIIHDKYQALTSMLPEMDWDYMSDRSNGELFLDLGISYHPPTWHEPLVGLWRLEQVNESYELMGMKKGTTHHTSMLARYGGRQAEMKSRRSQSVHLCFRSTYNLCFEVIRLPGQTNYLCNDTDAIKVNNKFLTACDHWKRLFQDAENRSYGVREEVRGSGLAIKDLLNVASEKVRITRLAITMI
jgi:hypothetical protein